MPAESESLGNMITTGGSLTLWSTTVYYGVFYPSSQEAVHDFWLVLSDSWHSRSRTQIRGRVIACQCLRYLVTLLFECWTNVSHIVLR